MMIDPDFIIKQHIRNFRQQNKKIVFLNHKADIINEELIARAANFGDFLVISLKFNSKITTEHPHLLYYNSHESIIYCEPDIYITDSYNTEQELRAISEVGATIQILC